MKTESMQKKLGYSEHSPNTMRHIAGCGLVKGPNEENIISEVYCASAVHSRDIRINLTKSVFT